MLLQIRHQHDFCLVLTSKSRFALTMIFDQINDVLGYWPRIIHVSSGEMTVLIENYHFITKMKDFIDHYLQWSVRM